MLPTELFVWEDDIERTIKFTNARSDGFMRKFDGTWHVQPFTQHTLDSIYRPQQQSRQQPQHGKGWLSPAGALSALQQRKQSRGVDVSLCIPPSCHDNEEMCHSFRPCCHICVICVHASLPCLSWDIRAWLVLPQCMGQLPAAEHQDIICVMPEC